MLILKRERNDTFYDATRQLKYSNRLNVFSNDLFFLTNVNVGSVGFPFNRFPSPGPVSVAGLSFARDGSTFPFVVSAKLLHFLQTPLADLLCLQSIPTLPSPALHWLHQKGGVVSKEIRPITAVYIEVVSGVTEGISRVVHRS